MINNLIYDYNKNDTIDAIDNSKIEVVNRFTTKINFYNPYVDEPLHKFWFFIPIAKIININRYSVSVAISRNNKKLLNSISSLDTLVDNITRMLNNNIENIRPSLTQNNNYPPTLELYIDNNTRFFNNKKKEIVFSELSNNTKVKLYIEFTNILINSNKCQKKWKIIQIQQENKIDLTNNLFDIVQVQPVIPLITNPPILPPPLEYKKHVLVKKKTNENTTTKTCYIPPTKNQLLEALNLLKKNNNKRKESKKEKKIIINDIENYKKEHKHIDNLSKKEISEGYDIINDIDIILKTRNKQLY